MTARDKSVLESANKDLDLRVLGDPRIWITYDEIVAKVKRVDEKREPRKRQLKIMPPINPSPSTTMTTMYRKSSSYLLSLK